MRQFNVAGPCDEEKHFLVPPEQRLPQARELVREGHFFVLHAPRQSGKTTVLRSLAHKLTAEGAFAALHFSCEAAEVAQDDYEAAERAVLDRIAAQAANDLPEKLRPPAWPEAAGATRLATGLEAWARACPRPLALFFDEIDAVRGESLRSILRQLRSGFPNRPAAFPHAVVLCGLRDVRDYKAASGGDPSRLGTSSPFNSKVASLTLDNFTFKQVRGLYLQHTRESGQKWTKQAIARAFELTQGQPWLVIRWPLGPRRWQREVLELKVWRPKKKDPREVGLVQLEAYLDKLGLKRGALVVFDRRPEAEPLEQRVRITQTATPKGYCVLLLRA